MDNTTTYEKLIQLLDSHNARYCLIDHAPEGRTPIVSELRGHPLKEAAKCIIVMLKLGKRVTKHVLGVVPGDAKVDLKALQNAFSATYVSFASRDIAEQLAGCPSGTVLPFPMDERLELVVDPTLFDSPTLYFNAARLDRSIRMSSADFRRITNPRLERIAIT